MSELAIFRGGPLDGQQRELSHARSVYSVVLPPTNLMIRFDAPADEGLRLETVDYRRVGRWSEPPHPIVYECDEYDDEYPQVWLPPDDALMAMWLAEFAARYAALPTSTRALIEREGCSSVPRHEDRYAAIASRYMAAMSPDAHTVRFSEMSAEAEAELAAWDEMLSQVTSRKRHEHGDTTPPSSSPNT